MSPRPITPPFLTHAHLGCCTGRGVFHRIVRRRELRVCALGSLGIESGFEGHGVLAFLVYTLIES